MAVTLFQSRVLADPKHGLIHTTNNNHNDNNTDNNIGSKIGDAGESGEGVDEGRLLRDASVMREFGTRILVAEKNIGKHIYSNVYRIRLIYIITRLVHFIQLYIYNSISIYTCTCIHVCV